MKEIIKKYSEVGLTVPEIFLPAETCDNKKWAVVACDQYTSEPEYWDMVHDLTKNSPSTYKITLPEIYLESTDVENRIKRINELMLSYVNNGILNNLGRCLILTERTFTTGHTRSGLIVALDLERYEYLPGTQPLIRPTEGTVEERLPPRLKIRKDAFLESPHILVLIDDPEKTVIEPVIDSKESFDKLYDFELMLNGGNLTGYKITDKNMLSKIAAALSMLMHKDADNNKFDTDISPFLYAVGDGNHSLATAKAHWNEVKAGLTPIQMETHPSRFALVEIVNLHDNGIIFEPIHRVIFGVETDEFLNSTLQYMRSKYPGSYISNNKPIDSHKCHCIKLYYLDRSVYLNIVNPEYNLEYRTIQEYLDLYLKVTPNVHIDYIHGEKALRSLSSKPGNIGLEMPPIEKFNLFKTVKEEGVLPRKSFSMGEANEKRYYMECRKIK